MTAANLEKGIHTKEPMKIAFDGLHTISPTEILADATALHQKAVSKDIEVSGKQLLLEAPEKMDFLIEGLAPRSAVASLAGGSDLGKSSLLRKMAIDVVIGAPDFLGFPLSIKHNSAIIACTEDDRSAIAFLLRKQTRGKQAEQLENLRFLFDWENLLQELDARLKAKPADLVIIDCFADAYGGDLKDSQKIRLFLNGYQQLSTDHNCFVLFLHHTGKRTENLEPSKNNLLSGQGFEAKMRLVMELRADAVHVSHRHLCIVKGNYLPSSMKKESFVLDFIEEDFDFINTGERVPFEMLSRQIEADGSKAKYEQAKELIESGMNYEKIAEKMGFASKGTITKLLDRAKKNGWDKESFPIVSTGNKRETKQQ